MPIDSNVRKVINDNGHIAIDEMMANITTSSPISYYKTTSDLGAEGDFVTAPVISQLFGEMVGLWIIDQWQKLGSPSKFTLLELGPGTGELMRDVLRSANLAKSMKDAAQILMYDINPHFIKKQKELLTGLHNNISWIDTLDGLPKQPIIVISNEFFDALPIKQFKKIKRTWYESVLVCDPMDSRLKYDHIEVNNNMQKHMKNEHPKARDGAVVEESVAAHAIIKRLGKLINKYTGAFLAIDYGYNVPKAERLDTQYNSTLQAIKDHEYQSMIDTLGEADLSAHVDFQALMMAAGTAGIKHGIIDTQERFLKSYGIMIRLEQLQKQSDATTAENLGKQVYRLTSHEQMGELFKVIQFWSYSN